MICSASLDTELKSVSRDLDIFKLSLRLGPSHVWILWAQNVWSTSSEARLIRPTPRLWTENNLKDGMPGDGRGAGSESKKDWKRKKSPILPSSRPSRSPTLV